jgi:hypothetical protein
MADETNPGAASPSAAATGPTMEDRQFLDILRAVVGKTITVVNPESYESAPVGYKLTTGFYRGKLTALGRDYLVMMTEFERKKGSPEPVKQYIPIRQIKRISLMKSERVLHL